MRVAILVGLIFIAWAINYELVESFIKDSVILMLIVSIFAIMDVFEFFLKIIKKSK